jgi:hypothetical protein
MLSRSGQSAGTRLIAQDQRDDVVNMYNKIAYIVREVNKLIAGYRATKAQRESEIDALSFTDHQKACLQTDYPRFKHLNTVLAEDTAHVILLEEFEKGFRIE